MECKWIIAAAAALLMAAPLAAQTAAPVPLAEDGPLPAVTTRHTLTLTDGSFPYRATWFEHVLNDSAGNPQATISATAYVREGTRTAGAGRPVLFLFNGGPGASSSPLHMNGIGPKLLGARDASGERTLESNPDTLLDVADLVFIDPVGTGFSRPLRAGGGLPYWSGPGDAAAVLALVRGWLQREGRGQSPLIFVGESYGGYRLGLMARDMADLNVAGLVLLSPALEMSQHADQQAINALPSMAVAAWHHRKVADDARTAAEVWDQARTFAQDEYAAALQHGTALEPQQARRIADRIAEMLHLPGATILAANLRVPVQQFLEQLVPGQIVGRLDTRVIAPLPPPAAMPDRPVAANDPALGLGRSNVIASAPIGRYLRENLRVPTKRPYHSLTLDVNFAWDFRLADPRPPFTINVADYLGDLLKARPEARLLVYGGYHDLATPALATRHGITHSRVPLERVEFSFSANGHSVFEGTGRSASAARLRRFLAAIVGREKGLIALTQPALRAGSSGDLAVLRLPVDLTAADLAQPK
jgi:carboxypeptidase C (cathepsin A)